MYKDTMIGQIVCYSLLFIATVEVSILACLLESTYYVTISIPLALIAIPLLWLAIGMIDEIEIYRKGVDDKHEC